MNTEEKGLLNQFRHRYISLVILRLFIYVVQIFLLLTCAFFVLSNLVGKEINDFSIGIGVNRIWVKQEYWSVICFLFSIFSFATVPKNMKEQIVNISLALKYLKLKKRTSAQKEVIIQAKKHVDEVDITVDKILQGKEEEIEPHEKRMFLRRLLIIFGISGISILTVVLIFVFGWNIPKVASIDLIIGYILIMFEAYYYQLGLRKKKIGLLEEKHKNIISNIDNKEEQFKLLQKIYYMKADRLSNYSFVLGVATGATNIISVLITILDTTSNADFQRIFALELDSLNAVIATVFMASSICFFVVDLIVQIILEPKILEMNINSKMNYCIEDYEALNDQYQKEMENSRLFSRKILDWARGVYEYNNDVMVRKYYRGEDAYISFKCMATVESTYPGRVPRYKLTALILWLCAFMGFVWGEAEIRYLIPITLITFIVYDILVVLNAVQLWNDKQEWLRLEEKIEKENSYKLRKEVKWDFIQYIFMHSIFMALVASINIMVQTMSYYWPYVLFILVILNLVGYLFIKNKVVIGDRDIMKPYLLMVMLGAGIIAISIRSIWLGEIGVVFGSVVLLMLLLVLEEILASFYRRWKKKVEEYTVHFPIGIIFIVLNWGITYICMQWNLLRMEYIGVKFFAWIYIEMIVVIIFRMLWGIVQVSDETEKV